MRASYRQVCRARYSVCNLGRRSDCFVSFFFVWDAGAGTEATQQRSEANESGTVQCQCCQRPQQEALVKQAPALASMAAVAPRWAPYSTHIRHVFPPTVQHQQQHQQTQHQQQQLRSIASHRTDNVLGTTTADWNTWNLENSQSSYMPRSTDAFHV
jgi:hypothetical protein